MRILWASNSPHSPSGYGVQTSLFVPRMAEEHALAVASNYGHQEGMLPWITSAGEILIYPQSADKFSLDILGHHALQHQADVVISHYDAWVYKPENLAGRWCPWYPMDTEHYPERVTIPVRQALLPITQTRYSVSEAAKVGLEVEYVPAAYDGSGYYPRSRTMWREKVGCQDSFVVGCVAANRGDVGGPSRKSYPQMFEAFSLFVKRQPNAKLYIHAHMDGHINLDALAQHYGIHDHLIRAHPYFLHTGLYRIDDMAEMYSGLDVLLSPSMGEGFGVPIVEAQACGTPVIVGDWTAMSEVARSGAKISKQDAFKYPIIGYGDQWLPQPGAICEALVESTKWPRADAQVSKLVAEYEVETVWRENWQPVLKKIEHKLATTPVEGEPQQSRQQRRAAERKQAKRKPERMPRATFNHVYTAAEDGEPAKRALLSFGTGPHEELLDIALPSYEQFARLHCYDLLVGKLKPPSKRPPSWWKIPMLLEALKTYDEVLFLGADLVIVDPEYDLYAPSWAWQALVPHKNQYGEIPNADVWLVRQAMRPILEQVWAHEEYTEHGWWEQAALLHVMGYDFDPLPCTYARPTDLTDERTVMLDDEWNVHVYCEQPEHPRILHATMHPDRAKIMREWAEMAKCVA